MCSFLILASLALGSFLSHLFCSSEIPLGPALLFINIPNLHLCGSLAGFMKELCAGPYDLFTSTLLSSTRKTYTFPPQIRGSKKPDIISKKTSLAPGFWIAVG